MFKLKLILVAVISCFLVAACGGSSSQTAEGLSQELFMVGSNRKVEKKPHPIKKPHPSDPPIVEEPPVIEEPPVVEEPPVIEEPPIVPPVIEVDLLITWQDNSTNETGFIVSRRLESNVDYGTIYYVESDITSFLDTGVQSGATYCYKVSAYNDAGQSSSSEVCINT